MVKYYPWKINIRRFFNWQNLNTFVLLYQSYLMMNKKILKLQNYKIFLHQFCRIPFQAYNIKNVKDIKSLKKYMVTMNEQINFQLTLFLRNMSILQNYSNFQIFKINILYFTFAKTYSKIIIQLFQQVFNYKKKINFENFSKKNANFINLYHILNLLFQQLKQIINFYNYFNDYNKTVEIQIYNQEYPMFEDLTKKINLHNLQKLRQANYNSRYNNAVDSDDRKHPTPSQKHNLNSDQSLDQLDIEFQEREQHFRKIQSLQQQQDSDFIKKDNSAPPNLLRKLHNQIQLLTQKIEIQRKQHAREMSYQSQLYSRRQQWLYAQINKLKFLVKKYQDDSDQVKQLKRNLLKCQQIKQKLEERIQNMEIQNKNMKIHIQRLEREKNKQQIKRQNQLLKQGNQQSQVENLVSKLKQNQQDLTYEKQTNQELRRKLEKARKQLQSQKQRILVKQKECQQILSKNKQEIMSREQNLKQQILTLRKRNQNLEQTFIDKMSQITRLQAHLLSNNSNQSYHSMSAGGVRHSIQNAHQSINLHDQSPIKPVLKPSNASEKKQLHRSYVLNPNARQQNNPEITNLSLKQKRQCGCCYKKIQTYKKKLEEANKTIINLLQQKIKCIKIDNDKSIDRTKIQGNPRSRTRIISLNNFQYKTS